MVRVRMHRAVPCFPMFLHGLVLNWAQGRVPFIISISEFEMRDKQLHMQVPNSAKAEKTTAM